MNVLLTGVSGFVGRNIAAALTAAGHEVSGVGRRQGIDFIRMQQSGDWLPHLAGIDAVINCVGIIGEHSEQRFAVVHSAAPCALFQACREAGVRRVVQISALGADETAFSAYHLSKRAADDYLRNLDLDWFVLRPALIYGRSGTSARLFMRLAMLPLIPVIDAGQQRLQPVHISDVVAATLHCLSASKARQTLDVVGSETFTFAEWLQTMRAATGRARARLLPVPLSWVLAAAFVARHFNPMLHMDNVRMLQAGYSADSRALARFLGRAPLAVKPALFFADSTSKRETS